MRTVFCRLPGCGQRLLRRRVLRRLNRRSESSVEKKRLNARSRGAILIGTCACRGRKGSIQGHRMVTQQFLCALLWLVGWASLAGVAAGGDDLPPPLELTAHADHQ